MGGAALTLREVPVFDSLERVAMTFACELVTDATEDAPDSSFRLGQVYRELFGPEDQRRTREPAGEALERARKLFASSRSFLDDITTGPPGVNGRPLLLSAELDGSGRSALAASIIRPPHWDYQFESTEVRLLVAPEASAIPVIFTDQFCVFESGRIFYLASFGQAPGRGPRLDEYGLIQLEWLTMDPASAADADFLGFRLDGATAQHGPLSLRAFFEARLSRLCDPPAGAPSAVRDVLRPFGIVADGQNLRLPERSWLRNGLLQIEDAAMLETARFAFRHYSVDDAAERTDEPGAAVAGADESWQTRLASAAREAAAPHICTSFDPEADTEILRPVLAFAGLAQGIPDFPRQDDSEVHDSTRPATAALEGMFYVHPAFELAVGINWRTFRDAQAEVGGCPYAIMAWIIGLHDEVIVADMEGRIERMIYGEPAHPDSAAALGRAEPVGDLVGVLGKVARFVRPRSAMIDDNLRARLDIFRWCSIHRSGNVFRYPTERELLDAIRQCRGTDARFDDAHGTLDRYENLVEDLSSLGASYAAVRTNWLLGAITVLSVVALPGAIEETAAFAGLAVDPLWATLALLGAAFALFLLWNRGPRRSNRVSSAGRGSPRSRSS